MVYNGIMFLTIDIGGTKTLISLFSKSGICTRRLKFKTSQNPETFAKDLEKNLTKCIPTFSRKYVKAITVAVPGVIDRSHDKHQFTFGNLNWPKDINLASPIKNIFHVPIFFANDANLATLYEANRRGRKIGKSIYLTFSTGIGGGIATDGKLLHASESFEPGHVKYTFKRKKLEWEDIASAKAIVSAYKCELLKEINLNEKNTKDIVERVSIGLIDIIESEHPDTIIIGGPLALIFDKLEAPLTDYLKSHTEVKLPKIKKAFKPTESVIYGGYAYSKIKSKE